MNNEWLNKLRSRMEDHEEDIPDGLWDDIRDELFSGEEDENSLLGVVAESYDEAGKEQNIKGTEIKKNPLWYRIGGIAATVAFIFLIMKLLPQSDENKVLAQKNTSAKKEKETISAQKRSENPIHANAEDQVRLSSDISLAQNIFNTKTVEKVLTEKNLQGIWNNEVKDTENSKETGKPSTAEPFSNEVPETHKIASAQETVNVAGEEKNADEVPFEELKSKEIDAENTKHKTLKTNTEKSWMLSMLTGNASSNSAEQQFPGYASISGKPMNVEQVWSTAEYEDDPDALTQILLANQSQPVEARIRHKIPVTLGLSLYYNLGKRWGIGTGLNYTKLASELHSGSDANYIKGDQIVHYIGIPVQVNYNVIQKGRFTGYVTGGALVEKPVSGSITTTYIVNDEIKETSKENLAHKPLQFSVNTAVGFQLKVIDRFGIYAEPGIGYHFKGENAPNTIYKEKPLHFNVKFGVRLLLD